MTTNKKNNEAKIHNIELFVQKEVDLIRYYSCGVNHNSKFTGIVHGYIGGGEYSDNFVYKGKFLPTVDNKGECLEWDEIQEIFNNLTEKGLSDKLDTLVFYYLEYNKQKFHFIPLSFLDFKNDIFRTKGWENSIPVSYGSTSWEDTKNTDSYTFDEVKNIIKDNQPIVRQIRTDESIKRAAISEIFTTEKPSWDILMSNDKILETNEDYQVCEEYECVSIEEIRKTLRSTYEELEGLIDRDHNRIAIF